MTDPQENLPEGPQPLMLVQVPAEAQQTLRHLVGSWPFGDPLTRLRGIREAHVLLDKLEHDTVLRARAGPKPLSWAKLGKVLGITGERMRQRHATAEPPEAP